MYELNGSNSYVIKNSFGDTLEIIHFDRLIYYVLKCIKVNLKIYEIIYFLIMLWFFNEQIKSIIYISVNNKIFYKMTQI